MELILVSGFYMLNIYIKEVILFPRMIKNLLYHTVCVTNVWFRSQLQLKTTNFYQYTQAHSTTAFEHVLHEFTELRDKDTATTSFTSLLNKLIMAWSVFHEELFSACCYHDWERDSGQERQIVPYYADLFMLQQKGTGNGHVSTFPGPYECTFYNFFVSYSQSHSHSPSQSESFSVVLPPVPFPFPVPFKICLNKSFGST